jgi:hypothetical protein
VSANFASENTAALPISYMEVNPGQLQQEINKKGLGSGFPSNATLV